ncbi:MAG: acetate--CoA ligase [Gammaproteobacteria bacterium]|nr:acetate--CoA ligase [Gammaproteobacteria bacterium]MBU6509374.1 acetate--CoA ligase [Gammaproteobacteria bacterium]MDE1983585.1 acetate--CoA ligase [Gammaproteobacteria bacterium]MDE2107686.1 acetate--CoA ligase [Gammaproteobacteria bacterium]
MSEKRKTKEYTEVSEAQIAVHWKEEEYFRPAKKFIEQANARDPDIRKRFAIENFPDCFREYADLLTWSEPYKKVLDTGKPPFWKWFVGGKLNACYNCVDRHLGQYRNKAAFIFVAEPEEEPPLALTYQELYVRVSEMAALLRDFCGLKAGDRVTLHLPMTPELPITMLACARLGVIHSQVFAGFSGQACGARIQDSGSHVLISMDAYWRAGKLLDHKVNADIAVQTAEEMNQHVDKVLIWQRFAGKYSSPTPMVQGRDFFVNDVLKKYRDQRVEPVPMDAEAPLFLMYTSGSTGKPKGCQHRTGGYLAYVAGTSKYIQDIHPTDTYWCMADIGWITGHSYIVYGPLAIAATSVMYEGVPTHPDAGRPWRIAERLDVNIFHTSPTAIRALRRAGPEEPSKYHYHFKHMTTVGEPIEPEAWRWYYNEVGKREAVIVDTWWQTENGGFLCSTLPALDPMKPGSAGPPVPGIYPVIYDEDGKEVTAGSGQAGNMCIRNPWPGIMQTIWGDPERFVNGYYKRYCKNPNSKDWRDWPYMAGDGAMQSADGYFRILGRIDDVINVAGHRLGTKEIENACLTVADVAEAAVVPVTDEIKGRMPEIYVALKPGHEGTPDTINRIIKANEEIIGRFARPKHVYVVPDMPKTRSGKIMRRVLASISNRRDVGDVTTLANPAVVEDIRKMVQGKDAVVSGEAVPEDIAKFGQND